MSDRGALVIGRLEQLRPGAWHRKARTIVGIATFFDGMDLIAIAYAIPMLAPQWHLNPAMIGFLISAGFVGQLIGALGFGAIADRIGRVPAMTWSIAIFSVMSFACAFSWSYGSLLVFRLIQGIGLGGELPVAATYVSEVSRAKGRGLSILSYQVFFAVGLAACSALAVWIVPHYGWQSLFAIGGLPALLTLFLRSALPESPRWLVDRGQIDRAERSIGLIEQASGAEPPARIVPIRPDGQERAAFADLFGPAYLRRTLTIWLIWFATSFVNYGITAWLPQIYVSHFHTTLEQALRLSLLTQIVGVIGTITCAILFDRVGRRWLFSGGFGAAALSLLGLATMARDTGSIAIAVTTAFFFISVTSIGAFAYTPELYPTRVRGIGTAAGSAWARFASIIGPIAIAHILAGSGARAVFVAMAAIALLSALIVFALAVNTRGLTLEAAAADPDPDPITA